MGRQVYIVNIEPLETRYTGHWYKYLPEQIEAYAYTNGKHLYVKSCQNIDGEELSSDTGAAFLNFVSTTNYKATQIARIAELFNNGDVQPGDIFLVTDAWNPCAHMIRYMSLLTNTPVKMFGIWHAGSYDESDIIARTFEENNQTSWARDEERALFRLFDVNFVATVYHKNLIERTFGPIHNLAVVGFPMEYYPKLDSETFWLLAEENEEAATVHPAWEQKKNKVIFPHRLSDEKRSDVFDEMIPILERAGIECVVAQRMNLTKEEYHKELRESKFVFSANEQETLGIGTFEAMAAGAIPMVPYDLSYVEIYGEYDDCAGGHLHSKLAQGNRNIPEREQLYQYHIPFTYDPELRNSPSVLAQLLTQKMMVANIGIFNPRGLNQRALFYNIVQDIFQIYFNGSAMYSLIDAEMEDLNDE